MGLPYNDQGYAVASQFYRATSADNQTSKFMILCLKIFLIIGTLPIAAH